MLCFQSFPSLEIPQCEAFSLCVSPSLLSKAKKKKPFKFVYVEKLCVKDFVNITFCQIIHIE